jgi:peroxiredoxin
MKTFILEQAVGKLISLLVIFPLMAIPLCPMVIGQESGNTDPETTRVREMIRKAWQEAGQFTKVGGEIKDETHPIRKLAKVLWQYREQNPGTPASAVATAEALRLMVYSDQINEALTRAAALSPDDGAWKYLITVLLEAADITRDYTAFLTQAGALLQQFKDKTLKTQTLLAMGMAYEGKGENILAKSCFEAVIAENPGSPQAAEAKQRISIVDSVGLGQTAPIFTARSTDGKDIKLSDYRGKVVILEFWATWCTTCVRKIPLVKELYNKNKDKGVVIIGVSLDNDAKALQAMVTKQGISWPQIRTGEEGELTKLFDVKGLPTYYVLDRSGKITARKIPTKQLSQVISETLQK